MLRIALLLVVLLIPTPTKADEIIIRPDEVIWDEIVGPQEVKEPELHYTTALVCDRLDQVMTYFLLVQRYGRDTALDLVNRIYPPQERFYPLACQVMTVTYTRGEEVLSLTTDIGRLAVVEVDIQVCHDSIDVVLNPVWHRVLVLKEEAA